MQSIMPAQKDFGKVPQIGNIQRSVFNRSHGHKTTFLVDYLIPFYVDEILPGDTQDVTANIYARINSPMEWAIMDNLYLDTFYFFVPNRILWTNWVKFMGEQVDPGDTIDYTVPVLEISSDVVNPETILDYMGVTTVTGTQPAGADRINALHQRAYKLIWNTWFRDQNLQDSLTVDLGDGPDAWTADDALQVRNKQRDYFTSCLPWPQKATTGVGVSLTGDIPVVGNLTTLGFTDGTTLFGMVGSAASPDVRMASTMDGTAVGTTWSTSGDPSASRSFGVSTDPAISGLEATLSSASAILINDLRLAIATQQLLELDARGGTRYVEILKAHFGVTSPDYRLQRPEYLGGGSIPIQINPVTVTTSLDSNAAGAQKAFGTMSGRSGYSKSFTEHGVIIGLANVRADITYQQGLHKMWTRQTRYDFYMPAFANLGEQAVLTEEIWYSTNVTTNATVFGYQERWAEYRYFPSRISGTMRSNAADTLEAWHLSQDFSSAPTLGNGFIISSVPLPRVLVFPNDTQILFDSYIEIKHARPMPTYSVPGLGRL